MPTCATHGGHKSGVPSGRIMSFRPHKHGQTCDCRAAPLLQTEAIKSGVQPGLTMVVGPPGTGKTDTAVQIMHVLYHNCPGQRTLLIAHSNQALNDLFEKILQRDVPARWVLALAVQHALPCGCACCIGTLTA